MIYGAAGPSDDLEKTGRDSPYFNIDSPQFPITCGLHNGL